MRSDTRSSILTTFALLLLAAGCLAFWIMQGQAHIYPDAPAGEFACLSYTPRSDSSKGAAPDIHAQIDRDLLQLSKRTHCVRTYSVMNGLDYVPTAARKLGMRVLLGIWIGSNKQANEQEINMAIATAKAQHDVIDTIIVGNEVLLRREQTAAALHEMLLRVRAATQLPVTYADVWDFWLKNPQLADASDYISIHILPYWDDDPIGVDHAMQHVDNIFQKLQNKFPGRRIYVGETGWPSEGRQREAAQPSVLNQARFTREFIALATRLKIPYNFIEAYDQPWKRRLEGTVGGYWGLYDANGREKFPLVGPVVADKTWWRGPLAGIVAACMLLLCRRMIIRDTSMQTTLQVGLTGFSVGALGVMQWDYLWRSNRTWQEWTAMSGLVLLTHGVVFLALFKRQQHWPRIWQSLLFVLLLSMAYINLGLVFDARYRDFPSIFLLTPLAMLCSGLQSPRIATSGEGRLLCAWLIASATTIAIVEGIHNDSALLWCAPSGLFGVRLAMDQWRVKHPLANEYQRAEHQT